MIVLSTPALFRFALLSLAAAVPWCAAGRAGAEHMQPPPPTVHAATHDDPSPTGRRLTAAERAELREQVRSQWNASPDSDSQACGPTCEHEEAGAPATAVPSRRGGWRAWLPWSGSPP